MKILGRSFDSNDKDLSISEDDRLWVIESFRWCRDALGYPKKLRQHTVLPKGLLPPIISDLADIDPLICEYTEKRLLESGAQVDIHAEDHQDFICLVAIYSGFGVLLANYPSRLSAPVLSFALATYAHLTNDDNPSWKSLIEKEEVRTAFEASVKYLRENVKDLYDEREAQASELFDQSEKYYKDGDIDAAIKALQQILMLSSDDHMRSGAYNNIGYHKSLKGEYQEAITNFQKSSALDPTYAYPVDNTAYCLLMLGDADSALPFLKKAQKMDNNDIAYSYRNQALYHQLKNDHQRAEEFFTKSLKQNTPVDLLEFHYAEFLLKSGAGGKAKQFFMMSVQKKEERGIARAKQLGYI